jgi:hypothetical protein
VLSLPVVCGDPQGMVVSMAVHDPVVHPRDKSGKFAPKASAAVSAGARTALVDAATDGAEGRAWTDTGMWTGGQIEGTFASKAGEVTISAYPGEGPDVRFVLADEEGTLTYANRLYADDGGIVFEHPRGQILWVPGDGGVTAGRIAHRRDAWSTWGVPVPTTE